MSTQDTAKPDAFKARMAEARAAGRTELAHQSRGRVLSTAEDRLAEGLMAIYAAGTVGEKDVAAALNAQGVARPSSDQVDWTASNLASELRALNTDLDAAYAQGRLWRLRGKDKDGFEHRYEGADRRAREQRHS